MQNWKYIFLVLILLFIGVLNWQSKKNTPAPPFNQTRIDQVQTIPAPSLRPSPSPCSVPFPNTRLALGGTLVLGDAKGSVCLFHLNGGPGFAARIGDRILKNELEVTAIDRLKVCVKKVQDGATFALAPPETTSKRDQRELGKAVGINQISEDRFVISGQFVKAELENLHSLLSSALAVPFLEGGKFAGFRLESIDPSSLFRALGLQPGDVLKGANEITFKDLSDGIKAYRALLNSQQIELRIVRNGEPKALRFQIRD